MQTVIKCDAMIQSGYCTHLQTLNVQQQKVLVFKSYFFKPFICLSEFDQKAFDFIIITEKLFKNNGIGEL